MILKIILSLMFGYLFGNFSTAFFVGKLNKIDISKYGSGNMGTTNALRTLGAKAGAITLIGDCLKAVAAVLLVKLVFLGNDPQAELFALYTGLGVVVGHNYPFWLKFKGGKGMAATGGVLAALDPLIIPIGLPIFVLIVAVTRYMSLGSIFVAILCPVWIAIRFPGNIHMLIVAIVFMALAIFKHRTNIKRLMNGTESKIGQRVKVDNKN